MSIKEWSKYKGYTAIIMEKVESLSQMEETQPHSMLDGIPKELADLYDRHHISIISITDEMDGVLFLAAKQHYKVTDIILSGVDFAVFEVMMAGFIFPTRSERDRRWLLCCYSPDNWTAVQTALKKCLNHEDGHKEIWRSLDVKAIQIDRKKVRCPEDMLFKISRPREEKAAVE